MSHQCQICQVILAVEQTYQCWAYHLSYEVMRLHQLEAGAIVCQSCHAGLDQEKTTIERREKEMECCQRCHGAIRYEIEEEDGFQFIASICSCAKERTQLTSHNLRYYEKLLAEVGTISPAIAATQFIDEEEMRL